MFGLIFNFQQKENKAAVLYAPARGKRLIQIVLSGGTIEYIFPVLCYWLRHEHIFIGTSCLANTLI